MEFLKQLTETPGISGREERVRDLIRKHTKGWWDELHEDSIGNLIGTIKAAKRKSGQKEKGVILSCHLDQIGFYVRYIDEQGFLRIHHAGGFDTRNLFARRVRVMTASGDLIGILNPATRPIHVAGEEEKKKIPMISEFMIDLGLPARTVKSKVEIGDPVVLEQSTIEMGSHVCGQAMDNRISPWIALNAIKKVKGKNIYDIYWVGSAQEEVGLRGAMVAAQNIEAEVAIAIDVTLAVDTPGAKKEESISTLGDGVAIKVMDGWSISTKSLLDDFTALAKKKKIKFQYEILPMGGTDAGAMQRYGGGRRAITLSVPCRYVHTAVEMVHKDDLKATVNLLSAWLMGS
ncbi:MAG: M20/M25/M40 family metallo-hydrolase [Candidatus Eisenbacteria bacterium]|nr:M20/M25/M40 family metallo-hydrolase [Candidatus Eisenbacteria bacterium]